MNKLTKQIRNNEGFIYETTKAEAEYYFYGDEACEFGTPVPKGMWEAMFVAPVLDEEERKEFLASHCECPLVRQLILESMKGDEDNE